MGTLNQQWHNIVCKNSLDEVILFLEENPDFEYDVDLTLRDVISYGGIDIFRYICREQNLNISKVIHRSLLGCSIRRTIPGMGTVQVLCPCLNEKECEHVALIRECIQPMSYDEKVKFFNDVLSKHAWKAILGAVKQGFLEVEIIMPLIEKDIEGFIGDINDTADLIIAFSLVPGLREMIITSKERLIGGIRWSIWSDNWTATFTKGKLLIDILREHLTDKDVKEIFHHMCIIGFLEEIKWFLQDVCQSHVIDIESIEYGPHSDPLSEACLRGNLEVIKYLVETYDIDINRFDHRVLRMSLTGCWLNILKWIHETVGLDIEVLNNNTHYMNNVIPVVEWLIENIPDFNPEKIVARMSKENSESYTIWLLQRKIPVPIKNMMSLSNHEHLQLLLDSFPENIDIVYTHYLSNWISMVPLTKELLDQFRKGLDFTFENILLTELCLAGSFNNAKDLMSLNPEFNFRFEEPFIASCLKGKMDQVEYLYRLIENVDLDMMSNAFRSAAAKGHVNVAEWLVNVCPELAEEIHVQQAMECANGLAMMKYLYSLCPVDLRFNDDCLIKKAVKKKQLKTAKWILGIANGVENVLHGMKDPFVEHVLATVA